MAKQKPKAPETEVETPAALAAMMALNPVLSKAWMEMMSEASRFVTERLQRDMELQGQLLACRTPGELMEVQTAFLQDMMAQYAEETSRYMKLAMQSAEDVQADLRNGHRRGYDDVPV